MPRLRGRALIAIAALLSPCLVGPGAHAALLYEDRFGAIELSDPSKDLLKYPYDVAVDPTTGNVFVVDNAAFIVLKYDKGGGYETTIGRPGTSAGHDADGQLYYPQAIAIDPSGAYLYVADTFNSRIQVFTTTDGTFVRKWGTQGAEDDQLDHPGGIAIDADGNVYVADTRNHRVMKFTSTGTFIKEWGKFGTGNGQFSVPVGIEVDRTNGVVYVTEDVGRVQRFSLDGGYLAAYGLGSAGPFLSNPDEISVDNLGFIYVVEAGGEGDGHEVSVIDSTKQGEEALLGEFKGSTLEKSTYGFSPHGIGFNQETNKLLVAAGGVDDRQSRDKVFVYNTQGKPRLIASFQDFENGRLVFRVEHDMMFGSCNVRATGELSTGDEFEGGVDFNLKGPIVPVPSKKDTIYRLRLSNQAERAAKKAKARVDLKFDAQEGCTDPLGASESPYPDRVSFKI